MEYQVFPNILCLLHCVPLCTCQLLAPLPHLRDRVGDSRGLDIVKLTNSPPLGHFLGANPLINPLLLPLPRGGEVGD